MRELLLPHIKMQCKFWCRFCCFLIFLVCQYWKLSLYLVYYIHPKPYQMVEEEAVGVD